MFQTLIENTRLHQNAGAGQFRHTSPHVPITDLHTGACIWCQGATSKQEAAEVSLG